MGSKGRSGIIGFDYVSVRTGQDLICSWNYFDSVTMWMTLCQVGSM